LSRCLFIGMYFTGKNEDLTDNTVMYEEEKKRLKELKVRIDKLQGYL